jgi:CRP-like cAMP-binding protein
MISEAPVDALRKLQNRSSRDECTRLVVLSLDGRRRFGLDYAMSATGLDRRKTLRVLNRLERDGFLKLLDERKEPNAYREFGPNRRNPLYQVVKDPALHPTRQKKTATARDVLWRTIRRMRRFTFQGLAESSGCTPASAQGFVQLLARDGWVRQDGLEGRRKVFVIVSDPGPQRPVTFEPKDGGRDERDEQKNG